MRTRTTLVALTLAVIAGAATGGEAIAQPSTQDAVALVEMGLRHMGGRALLESIHTVRLDMMTQWQRTSWLDVPYPDHPSYEHHVDVRDYAIPAWRNTRAFGFGPGGRHLVNIVRDSIALMDPGDGARPLSVAYVDERRELFAYTPDRLMVGARNAPDLREAGDTAIAGVPNTRVEATVNGIAMTLFLRTSDGLPTMTRFRRGHPNDFGLVPWGEMDVEVWYSSWRTYREGVSLPAQWDVRRVGVPYKRLTVLSAAFNPDFAPDSFAVTSEQRATYLASSAVRPMHDIPLDSARVVEGFLADFRAFGSPGGALRMGDAWLLLDAGQAPLSAGRALDWLQAETGVGAAAAVVGGSRGHGGVAELVRRGVPTLVAPGVATSVTQSLAGYGIRDGSVDHLTSARWLRVGPDSVRVEAIHLPDAQASLLVWSPTHRWLYAPDAVTPLDLALVMEHADGQGWLVDRVGTARGILQPRP